MSIHADSGHKSSFFFCLRLFSLGVLIISSPASPAEIFGQAPGARHGHSRDQTQGYIDDYSNSLESEFENARRSGSRSRNELPDVDIKTLRSLIRSFSDNLAQLTYALNEQIGQVPGLRQSYNDALRLSGTSLNIYKHSDKHGMDPLLHDQLIQLDADWRELAYRLESVKGLPEESLDLVKVINDADLRMRKMIGIQPQLDRRQLYLKAAGLAADLENLQEDVASELGTSQETQVYRRSLSRLRQIVLNLITVIRDDKSDASVIVEEYKQFEALWPPLLAKLRTEEDRYIERGLRRVSAMAGEVHKLLLLPQKVDQTQCGYLAAALKRDIDEFFERTPLMLVMNLPKSKSALATAEQLYSACAQFTETLDRGGQESSQILAAFQKIETAERAFIDVYRDVDSDKALAVLNRIHRSIEALRASLHLQHDDFDSHAAGGLAASIQNFAEQIEATSKRWLQEDRQSFAEDCLQEVANMSDRAAQLHNDIDRGKPQDELKPQMAELYDTWRRVYDYIIKCQTEDRPRLGRISAGLTPALVELRTMILQ